MSTTDTHPYPAESQRYRDARNAVLQAEIALRRQLEAVAALRRQRPLGGRLKEDYVFEEGGSDADDVVTSNRVRFSELLGDGKDTLIVYSYMFGLADQEPCPACTSILDGLDGSVLYARQVTNVTVVARAPIRRLREFARNKGWRHHRLLSSAHNSFNADYYGETPDGDQLRGFNVFVRREGRIYHTYGSEMVYLTADPGQDQRHVDMVWPIWHLLDLTPEGRGTDWYPALTYDAA